MRKTPFHKSSHIYRTGNLNLMLMCINSCTFTTFYRSYGEYSCTWLVYKHQCKHKIASTKYVANTSSSTTHICDHLWENHISGKKYSGMNLSGSCITYMVHFSPSIEQQKQFYNCKANDFGVVKL